MMKKKKIAHVKFTNCAWDPDDLVLCFNKYSNNYESILIYKSDDCGPYNNIPLVCAPTDQEIYNAILEYKPDLIHFHNRSIDIDYNQLIQFHSPPHFNADFVENYNHKRLVLGQVWAILPEYQNCQPVPLIMDIFDDKFKNIKNINEKIRIGFSPSITYHWPTGETGKGYSETSEILKRIVSRNNNVEIDIITNTPLNDCIMRKSQCDILIDECVNRGYHRCSIEGMALGKLTICSLHNSVLEIVKKMMDIDTMPMHNIWIQDLELGIQNIINKGKAYIHNEGIVSRKWMEENWNPQKIVKIFEKIYDQEINI